ncbi:hypothetical protein ACFYYS_00345 [Streptomyces sp. NPDC002120]|uniref:hypothetical protein n=1 Tax=Streptomyces sp. NPDC002120 TaxID=3364631 RepID=UPI0036A27C6E
MYAVEFINAGSDVSEVGPYLWTERMEHTFSFARRWHDQSPDAHPRVCVYVVQEERPITRDDCPDYTMSVLPGGYVQVADYRNEIPHWDVAAALEAAGKTPLVAGIGTPAGL